MACRRDGQALSGAAQHHGMSSSMRLLVRIHPVTAAYRDGAEPALCFYGRSLERR